MVGGRGRRVVAVVGGQEQQIVLAKCGEEPRKRGVEVAEPLVEPHHVVSVPPDLVEIY
jgi:hypothetical protein